MKHLSLLIVMLFVAFYAKAIDSRTVACTAGNLSTLSTTFSTTVTNLTVTGTIDARDFKSMRDEMPLLEVIDLSGITVSEYVGTEGTVQGGSTTTYKANEIPKNAFYGKISLKTFNFPGSIETIGSYAFYETGLTGSLVIPNSVITIEGYAYYHCESLSGALTIGSSVTTIGNSVFARSSGLTGPLTIPNSVTAIHDEAFVYCTGFSGTLTLGSSITSIGRAAFFRCTGFNGSLILPSSVVFIGESAFGECFNFSGSLTIGNSVTTIGTLAFASCYKLNGELTIPSSVTTINDGAFYQCTGLTAINAHRENANGYILGYDVFNGIDKSVCVLNIPQGSMLSYQGAEQWQDFLNKVEIIPTLLATDSECLISVYPTITQSDLKICGLTGWSNGNRVDVRIVDLLGNTVLSSEWQYNGNEQTINVSTLANGSYLMELQCGNSKVVKRFIKE